MEKTNGMKEVISLLNYRKIVGAKIRRHCRMRK